MAILLKGLNQRQHQEFLNDGSSCKNPFSVIKTPNAMIPIRGIRYMGLVCVLKISDRKVERSGRYDDSPKRSQMGREFCGCLMAGKCGCLMSKRMMGRRPRVKKGALLNLIKP